MCYLLKYMALLHSQIKSLIYHKQSHVHLLNKKEISTQSYNIYLCLCVIFNIQINQSWLLNNCFIGGSPYKTFSEGLLTQLLNIISSGPQCGKTCRWGSANNTGTDQLAHQHSLISAFVIRVLESTVSKFATYKILFF